MHYLNTDIKVQNTAKHKQELMLQGSHFAPCNDNNFIFRVKKFSKNAQSKQSGNYLPKNYIKNIFHIFNS